MLDDLALRLFADLEESGFRISDTLSADITAALANRVALEVLSAIARRRRDAAGGTPWDPALPLLADRES